MSTVLFNEVDFIFQDNWTDSAEHLFYEIAWDVLENEGLTTYKNDKTYALIYVYAYVIQMLSNEFSAMAFDEYCSYEFEAPGEEPLTDAAIGWLYRDLLSKNDPDTIDSHFCTDESSMLSALVRELRHAVADVLFQNFGLDLMGKLLYFAISGKPLKEDENFDEDGYDEAGDEDNTFSTKKDLLSYCKTVDFCVTDELNSPNGWQVMHWLETCTCAIDD